jgi:hypothetical protein
MQITGLNHFVQAETKPVAVPVVLVHYSWVIILPCHSQLIQALSFVTSLFQGGEFCPNRLFRISLRLPISFQLCVGPELFPEFCPDSLPTECCPDRQPNSLKISAVNRPTAPTFEQSLRLLFADGESVATAGPDRHCCPAKGVGLRLGGYPSIRV